MASAAVAPSAVNPTESPPAPVTGYPLAVTGSMMTGTSTACPLFSTQLRTRSFYTGDKRAGMESLGVQRLPSGQRNRPRDLNFYIMQRAKSLRQIDRKVRARNRCSGCTRAAPRLSRRGRGGEPDQAAPAFGEGLVPGLSRLRDRPAPSLAPQHQALAPDAGARLLRLRDEHQSPHPPPQGNVPSARAPAGGQIRPTDPAGGKTRAARRDSDDRHARGWQRRLAERGFQMRGHRLIRRRSERKEKDEESEPRN